MRFSINSADKIKILNEKQYKSKGGMKFHISPDAKLCKKKVAD